VLFVSAPQRRKRSPAFAGSIFLHGALASVLALKPLAANVSEPTPLHSKRKYSVVLLQFQAPPPVHQPLAAPNQQTPNQAKSNQENRQPESMQTLSANLEQELRRRFELPPDLRTRPVKQTLVQPDVPPEVVLKQEIPLPTALLWTQLAKPSILPPLSAAPRVVVDQPVPPKLDPRNAEPTVSDLRIAEALLNQLPQLPRPAATTSPVRTADSHPASQIPENSPAVISQTTVPVNLISDPSNPVNSTTMVVVLPANQVVPSGVGSGKGILASLTSGPGNISDPHAGANGSQEDPGDDTLPGTTRIDLPKDGKFGAVVLASAESSPYPESETALSGKLIRTVYLQMGLRKSWILQYCQQDAGATATSRRATSEGPIEAPWPFLMIRPNDLSTSDYVVVHGIVTADGRFDQLALVFPEDLSQKDLVMSSLKRWQFRPASQAGQNEAVEVLLIIPRESD